MGRTSWVAQCAAALVLCAISCHHQTDAWSTKFNAPFTTHTTRTTKTSRAALNASSSTTTRAEDVARRLKAIEALEAKEKDEAANLEKMLIDAEDTDSSPTTYFPLSRVVGQEPIKTALLLAAINTRIGGVCISGEKGTAKSVMARGLHSLLPPIERIKGNKFNVDPATTTGEIDSFLRTDMKKTGKKLADYETEVVPCPFVQVPLNVLEDRLIGSVDIEESVQTGETVFQPGLLAEAHRGILFVDDINLLDSDIANVLISILSDGWVDVQREGLSVRYPCRPLVISTFNPEEGAVRDHLLDRFAVSLRADARPLSVDQRVEVVDAVQSFTDIIDPQGSSLSDPKMAQTLETERQELKDLEDSLKSRIVFSREELKDIRLSEEQILYLCEEAARAGCQGNRGEIFAAEIARASAALEGNIKVTADDLQLAVKLAITPRGTYVNNMSPEEMEEMMPPPPPPPPPEPTTAEDEEQEVMPDDQMDDSSDEDEREEPEEEEQQQEDEPPPEEEEEDDQDDEAPPQVPQEFMFDSTGTPIDPALLEFANKQKQAKAGGRGMVLSMERGRYIKPLLPRGKVTKLAVDATLRAAAPYQKARRERDRVARASEGPEGDIARAKKSRSVFIDQSDVRAKLMARKAGCLIIFVVDASGSMALNRMNAAKGAAMSLLEDAYQSRDKVCIIPFQGERAEVLLPPTSSVVMARQRLEQMPCGGGSPLAHGLYQASRTAMNVLKGGDVGRVLIVAISDGRANVPLKVSMGDDFVAIGNPSAGKKAGKAGEVGEAEDEEGEGEMSAADLKKLEKDQLQEEVLNMARLIQTLEGVEMVVLDTENKFVSTGIAKDIAKAAGGRYHYIPKATDAAIAQTTKEAVELSR